MSMKINAHVHVPRLSILFTIFLKKQVKYIVFQALHGVVRWSFQIVQLTSSLRFFVSSLTSSTNDSKSPPSPI